MPSAELTDTELAAIEAGHERLPRRVRDVLYGKLAEREQIVALLNEMSVASARHLALVHEGQPVTRDPLVDHVIGLIVGCAHVPESDRVVVPGEGAAALVGLTSAEREHFGRED